MTAIGDRFCLLHAEKTCGTFAWKAIADLLLASFVTAHHLRYAQAQIEDLLVMGTVRDPWSFYMSFYWSQVLRSPPGAWLKPYAQAAGSTDPMKVIKVLVDPSGYDLGGDGLQTGEATRIADLDLPFYTFIMRQAYMVEQAESPDSLEHLGLDIAIDGSRVAEGLIMALSMAGVEVSPAQCSFIRGLPKRNTSGWSGNVEDYYSDEIRELIAAKHAWWIETFGFRFGQESCYPPAIDIRVLREME